MSIGTVKSFDARKGSGFITPENGGADLFVHVSEVERAGIARLNGGERLSYDVQTDRALQRSFATNLALI
jgi:CspA family cold shock protein